MRRAVTLNAGRKANLSVPPKSPQFGENHRENTALVHIKSFAASDEMFEGGPCERPEK